MSILEAYILYYSPFNAKENGMFLVVGLIGQRVTSYDLATK